MVKITFSEPDDSQWMEWCSECVQARNILIEHIANGELPAITDLYKDKRMTRIYKSSEAPFFGKCAYCESNVLANQPGDIEHWRPKNRVTDEQGRPVLVDTAGTAAPHPGYYWLAYEWRNLLFACEDCNRPSTAKTPGRRIGKWDQFPVRDFRATSVGDESMEEPLLLNPLEDNPQDHIEVDGSTGVLIAKTDRGNACIEIFGLNVREALVSARLEFMKATSNRLQLASLAAANADENQLREFMPHFERIKAGSALYSAAGRVALNKGKARLESFVTEL